MTQHLTLRGTSYSPDGYINDRGARVLMVAVDGSVIRAEDPSSGRYYPVTLTEDGSLVEPGRRDNAAFAPNADGLAKLRAAAA